MAAAVAAAATTVTPMPSAILMQDVEHLGERGAVVDVSKGYLRNYLIPRKLAAAGDEGRARRGRAPRRGRRPPGAGARREGHRGRRGARAAPCSTISQQAGDDGRLFGSVTNQDIADAIEEARGVKVDRRKIHLEEPIKNVGTYVVVVEVAEGVTASVKTMVVEKKSKRPHPADRELRRRDHRLAVLTRSWPRRPLPRCVLVRPSASARPSAHATTGRQRGPCCPLAGIADMFWGVRRRRWRPLDLRSWFAGRGHDDRDDDGRGPRLLRPARPLAGRDVTVGARCRGLLRRRVRVGRPQGLLRVERRHHARTGSRAGGAAARRRRARRRT